MTVKELREILNEFKDEDEVLISWEEWFSTDAGTSLSTDKHSSVLGVGKCIYNAKKRADTIILAETGYVVSDVRNAKIEMLYPNE